MIISFETFEKIYKPIKNTLVEDAAIDGYMFETYGEELAMVKATFSNRIWTFFSDDDGDYISNGYNLPNRIGHLITEVPFDIDSDITININLRNIRLDILNNTPEINDIIVFNPPRYKGLVAGTCVGLTNTGLPKITLLPKYNNISFKLPKYNIDNYYVPKTGFVIINKTI